LEDRLFPILSQIYEKTQLFITALKTAEALEPQLSKHLSGILNAQDEKVVIDRLKASVSGLNRTVKVWDSVANGFSVCDDDCKSAASRIFGVASIAFGAALVVAASPIAVNLLPAVITLGVADYAWNKDKIVVLSPAPNRYFAKREKDVQLYKDVSKNLSEIKEILQKMTTTDKAKLAALIPIMFKPELGGLFTIFSAKDGLTLACKRSLSEKIDTMKKELADAKTQVRKKEWRSVAVLIGLIGMIALSMVPVVCITAASLGVPIAVATGVGRLCKNEEMGRGVFLMSMAVLTPPSIVAGMGISTSVGYLMLNSVNQLDVPPGEKGNLYCKIENLTSEICDASRRAERDWNGDFWYAIGYGPTIRKIQVLFEEGSLMLTLPLELQLKILELGLPEAIKILQIAANTNADNTEEAPTG
jgi:hypothetical protein